MDELLARQGFQIKSFTRGEKIKAKLIRMTSDMAIFDIGGKSEGVVRDDYFSQASKFIKNLGPGDEARAIVINPETPEGVILLSLRDAAFDASWEKLEKAKETGKPVVVVGKNASDKGITVETDFISGFIPLSQIGKSYAGNPESLAGKRFKAKVIELNKSKKRALFSEKAVSDKEDIKLEKKALEKLSKGEVLKGKVTQVTDFGAFVKVAIGKLKVEGLVHVSELSWKKVGEPSDVVSEGDVVETKVLGVNDGKLSLSMKQAGKDPWTGVLKKYKKDAKVRGKVVKKSGFGAFVQLEPGVEGLVHITKIPPGTSLEINDEIDCYVEDVDEKARKISLGLILTSKPVGYK